MRQRLDSRNRRANSLLTVPIAILLAALPLAAAAPAAAGNDGQRVARMSDPARVNIREFAFHPRKLTVARGTKVVFRNNDTTAHTATRAGSFETGHIRPGHSAAVPFKRSGVFAYHCSIHNFMHGKIVVR
jgi:plastocyanin